MTLAYEGHGVTVHIADALDVLAGMADASVDAVVTDPPYGLEFMGKAWDSFGGERNEGSRGGTGDKGILPGYGRGGTNADVVRFKARGASAFGEWCRQWAVECLRVLKPGGHLVAFGGSRTWHRLACAIEDAGFEVRDSIAWLYGSGFPKSLDVSKAIDRAAGYVGEVIGTETVDVGMQGGKMHTGRPHVLAERDVREASPEAARWQGWGTALKPAFEPIVVARKPLAGTVAANVLTYGTGALNIDACRVAYASESDRDQTRVPTPIQHNDARGVYQSGTGVGRTGDIFEPASAGRWPANVVLDRSQADALDQQSGDRPGMTPGVLRRGATTGTSIGGREAYGTAGPQEVASRFFPTFRYEAKAPTNERPRIDGSAHPTVKPLDLMRWLVRLTTPPDGLVLDPFAGSGTTAEACILEGFRCITIDKEPDHLPLILQRINRQRDPVEAIRQRGEDLGLFDLEDTP